MPKVTLGDGRSLTVGDEFLKLSPPDQQAWVNEVASKLPAPAPAPTSAPAPKDRTYGQRAEGLYRAADEGAIRGVAGLVGLPGSLSDLGQWAGRKAGFDIPQTENILPRPADVEAKIRQGPLYEGAKPYEPQGMAEEYARSAGEFLPGGLLTGGTGGLVRQGVQRAANVLAPAVVSEAAGQATKGTPLEPYARFAGAVTGGVGGALATRAPVSQTRALEQGLKNVTQQEMDAAQALMRDAARGPNPVNLTWPEAISQVTQRPVLGDTMRHLEASGGASGERLSQFFGARPDQVEARVGATAETLAPGARARPSSVGPAAGEAATGALEGARRDINLATVPLYAAGERAAVTPAELAYFRQSIPGFEDAARAVRENPQLARYVAHLPDESVGFLDAVKQELQQAATTQRGGVQPGTGNAKIAAGLERDADTLRAVVEQASRRGGGETAQAMATQAARREAEVTPLVQGPLGKLLPGESGPTTTENAITALFPKDPNVGSAAEITDAVTRMRQQNPRAAADLIRQHVENAFNKAQTDLQGGRNQASGAKLRRDIFGNPQQRENLQAAVEAALPDGAARWRGVERMMDVMEATGTRQGIGSKTAYNLNRDQVLGIGGLTSTALKGAKEPVAFLKPLIEKYEQWKLGSNKDELARILTDPGSGEMLRKLSGINPASHAAARLTMRLLTYGGAASQHTPDREKQRDLTRVYITKPN